MTTSYTHTSGNSWSTTNLLAGREGLLETILTALQADGSGVFITGQGGKNGLLVNELGQELAKRAQGHFSDGVFCINLHGFAPLSHPALESSQAQRYLLAQIVAPQSIPQDSRALTRMYRNTFANRNALLLLNDAADAQQVRYLIPRNGAKVIITSVRDLSSSFPKLQPYFVPGLEPEAAYQLLTAISPRSLLQNKRSSIKLCEFLEFNPMAIVVFAPLLEGASSIQPRELIARFQVTQQRISALLGDKTSPSILDAAMEIAYDALDPQQQQRLMQLAVFPGTFTPEDARSIWNVNQAEANHSLRLFSQRNLIKNTGTDLGFNQHWSIRRYAERRLLSQPELAGVATQCYIQAMFQHTLPEAITLDVTQPFTPEAISLIRDHLTFAWKRSNNQVAGWTQVSIDPQLRLSTFLRLAETLQAILIHTTFQQWLDTALSLAPADDASTLEVLQQYMPA